MEKIRRQGDGKTRRTEEERALLAEDGAIRSPGRTSERENAAGRGVAGRERHRLFGMQGESPRINQAATPIRKMAAYRSTN